jgi:hypothetical protein
MIQKETTMRLDWITEQLNMRTPAGVLRLACEVRKHFVADHALGRKIEAMSNTVNTKSLTAVLHARFSCVFASLEIPIKIVTVSNRRGKCEMWPGR